MFGKKHSEATKAIMSEKKNKYPLGVGTTLQLNLGVSRFYTIRLNDLMFILI
jgi:hypothetical protein